jgi:hypothetical protein
MAGNTSFQVRTVTYLGDAAFHAARAQGLGLHRHA